MPLVLEAVAGAGAVAASFIALRLPAEVSPLFQDWLAQHFPDRAAKVMGRVRVFPLSASTSMICAGTGQEDLF